MQGKTGRVRRATIDGELRSPVDIKTAGGYRYVSDPHTEVMCLRYRLPWHKEGEMGHWNMAHPRVGIEATPPPQDLFDFVADGGFVEAHNAGFERGWWDHIAVPRMGWPAIPFSSWMCSAAKASAHALPRDLDSGCRIINKRHFKDPEGSRLIRLLCSPVNSSPPYEYHEDAAEIRRFWDYCGTDVLSEEEFSEAIPDLSDFEREVWLATEEMNARGIRIDRAMCLAASDLIRQELGELNERLRRLCHDPLATAKDRVERASQKDRIKKWLKREERLELPNMQAGTLDAVIAKGHMSKRAKAVLETLRLIGGSASNKYDKALAMMDAEDRVRDILMYSGAERTGRFAGKGLQVHNFKRGGIKDMDAFAEVVKTTRSSWMR